MLKILLLGIMLMCFVSSWELVQVLMFFVLNFHSKMRPWFLFVWVGLYNGNSLFKVHFNFIKILDSGFNNLLSEKVKKIGYFSGGFLVVNLLLMVALMLTFSSMNFLLFYVGFESSLIPNLILSWGYQPERIQAGVYMLFYTLFASLPLLVCILALFNKGGSLSMGLAMSNDGGSFVDNLWYFCFHCEVAYMYISFMVALGPCGGSGCSVYDFSRGFVKVSWVWYYSDFSFVSLR